MQSSDPKDYPNLYEYRRYNLWRVANPLHEEEDCVIQGKHISYFMPRARGESEITGKVKQIPEVYYDKVVDLSWAIGKLKGKYMTKKGEMKKKHLDMPPYEQYNVAALMLYLNTAYQEGSDKVLLSWQELKLLEEK